VAGPSTAGAKGGPKGGFEKTTDGQTRIRRAGGSVGDSWGASLFLVTGRPNFNLSVWWPIFGGGHGLLGDGETGGDLECADRYGVHQSGGFRRVTKDKMGEFKKPTWGGNLSAISVLQILRRQ